MINLIVDMEFQALIQPPTPEERVQLEASLLAEGCRDRLVVWAGTDAPPVCVRCQAEGQEVCLQRVVWEEESHSSSTHDTVVFKCPECSNQCDRPWTLLDGHTRYPICQAHQLRFGVVEAPGWVKTRDDAKIWIIQHQFARRNLGPYQRAELALALEPLIAEQAKRQQGARTDLPQKSAEGFQPMETREALAKRAGVSHDTIRKVKAIMQRADEPVKDALRRGERSIHGVFTALQRPSTRPNAPGSAKASSTPTTAPRGRKRFAGEVFRARMVELHRHFYDLDRRHFVEHLVRTWRPDVAKGYLGELQQLITQLQGVAQRIESVIRDQGDG